jgi:HAE1 family hydrophobic/amphiphilic exporter-1
MEGVDGVMAGLNAQYRARGIELRKVYDATIYINEAIDLVSQNLLIGALLATLVLLFFLRSKSAVLVLGLSIPISIISTFIFLALFDRTLNIISLAGMTFVTGMVLDSAIVVVENIFRHRELGKGQVRAAYDGAVEVWGAILASTLTTLAVFLPIVMVEEEAGQIFRDIAIVVSIAVALSLVVAITVIPSLATRLLRTAPRTSEDKGIGRLLGLATRQLTRQLEWTLRSSLRRLSVAAAILAAAVAVSWALVPEIDYLPTGNRNMVYVSLDTPPGYNLQHNERILRLLEERFLPMPEVFRMFAIVRHERPFMGIVLKEDYKDKAAIRAFMDRVKAKLHDVPGVREAFVRQAPLIRRGRFSGGNLDLLVQGDDLARVQQIASELDRRVRRLDIVTGIDSNAELGKPELIVDIDRVRAAELGLTVAEVGSVVETAVSGMLVGSYDDGGREIDLRLRGPLDGVHSPEALAATLIHTPTDQTVNLGDLADIDSRTGPTQIQHTDMDRSIKLSVATLDDLPLGEAVSAVAQVANELRATLPLGYTIELAGQAGDLERTWTAFRGAFMIALLITYLLLASLFESFRIPIVILVSVPFAAAGGIVGLSVLQLTDSSVKLDTITMLGFVILIGVVVNNAILLVHQTLNRLRDGAEPTQALLDAVASRVRPILMTMTTTCFGMLPLVFASGSGSELYRGLAATLIGGLILATFVTLLLVPTLLSFLLEGVREREPAGAAERA